MTEAVHHEAGQAFADTEIDDVIRDASQHVASSLPGEGLPLDAVEQGLTRRIVIAALLTVAIASVLCARQCAALLTGA